MDDPAQLEFINKLVQNKSKVRLMISRKRDNRLSMRRLRFNYLKKLQSCLNIKIPNMEVPFALAVTSHKVLDCKSFINTERQEQLD